MCNVASRLIFLAVVTLILMASCANKAADSTPSPAQEALTRANSLVENGEYAEALKVFDEIDSLYAGEVAVRREVVRLRPKVIEQYCNIQLAEIDSMMGFAEARRSSLLPKMVQESVKGFDDGYSTASAGYNPNFYSTTGIQGRVTTVGDFYIVSSLTGKPLKHNSITFATTDGSVTTPEVDASDELGITTSSGEVVSYFGDAPEKIGELASQAMFNDVPTATVTLHGAKGDREVKLTPAQIEGLATAWEFSDNFKQLRRLSIERDRLKATLATAQSQQTE